MEHFQSLSSTRFLTNLLLLHRITCAALPSLLLSLILVLSSACAKSGTQDAAGDAASSNSSTPATNAAMNATNSQSSANATSSASPQPNANASPDASASKSNAGPPPTLAEAQSAVARIYKNALTIETAGRGGTGPFIVGDFNGDDSQDIAIVARPAKGALATLNGAYPNWILEDVTKVAVPVERSGAQVLPSKTETVKVEQNDQLLVIIHGYKQEGWRNAQAQQTYLLKSAVGENMRAQPIKYALSTGASGKNPHLSMRGDVIKETLGGREGFIYWTGAQYAWQQ